MLVAVAVVGLVLTASACGGSKNTPDTTTSSAATAEWTNSVCTAFTTWKSSLQDAKSTLTTSGVTSDTLTQAESQAHDANQELARTLQSLGAPETAGGEKASNNLADLDTSLSFSMAKIKETVDQKASTPAELAAELTTVKQAVATMTAAFGTAVTNLKQLNPRGELEQAFNDSSACSAYFA